MDTTPGPLPDAAARTRFPRLCVSAASGGGGKTLLTLGLARAFRQAGLAVKPFKKGPDYIDAAWLGRAAGMPATNLDPFFLAPGELAELLGRSMDAVRREGAPPGVPTSQGAALLGLVEGNRGLFDGLDAEGSCSTARLARALACPLLLCLDATKMTRTAAALLAGLTTFEPGLTFCGVVFNRVGSPRHAAALRRAMAARLDLPVLGVLPRLAKNPLPERHMGIASRGGDLADEAEALLDDLARLVREHVEVEAVLAAARNAPPLPGVETGEVENTAEVAAASREVEKSPAGVEWPRSTAGAACAVPSPRRHRRPRIGYARDAAFWFYYPENLAALEAAGAETVPLALTDAPNAEKALWETLDGLYLGGGFPEDFLPRLSGAPVLETLAALSRAGLPVYAECGGLLLLSQGMEREDAFWPLAGVLPLRALWTARPQGLGYVEAQVRQANPFFPVGLVLRGHEFHYSRCVREPGAPAPALALRRGTGMGACADDAREDAADGGAGDGLVCGNTWGAYTHIFAPAVPCWAPRVAAAAAAWRAARS